MRKKLKFLVASLLLTTIFWTLMNVAGLSVWVVCGFHCGKLGTAVLYYSIYGLGATLHLFMHKGSETWKGKLFVAFLPCSVFFTFHISLFWYTILIGLGVHSYFFGKDLKEILRRRRLKPSLRGRKTILLILHCMEKNLLHMSAYVGAISFLIFMFSTVKVLGDSSHSDDNMTQPQTVSEERKADGALYADNKRYLQSAEIGNLWDGNREILAELNSKRYPSKSMEERLQAWQALLELECAYLGTPTVPTLGTEDIEKKGCNGYYSSSRNVIILDLPLLADARGQKRVLSTLLHEAYHHYSFCASQEMDKLITSGVNMNLLFARDISDWNYEQQHYYSYDPECDDLNDYDRYRFQRLEESANAYADEWCSAYWNYIESIE